MRIAILTLVLSACSGSQPTGGSDAGGPGTTPITTSPVSPTQIDAGTSDADTSQFSISATIATPSTLTPGQVVALSTNVTAHVANDNVIVDLEVKDAAGSKIGQTFQSNQSFTADESTPYSWSFTVPTSAVAGQYSFVVAVFAPDWSVAYFLDQHAATFAVAATPSAASSASITSSATALLAYLNGLSSAGSKHLLVGQHTNYWDPTPTDDITGLSNATGKDPAIVGVIFDIAASQSPEGIANGPMNGLTLANSYIDQGYIVLVSEPPGSPANGATMWEEVTPSSPMDATLFANITTQGTAEYQAFQAYLQTLATHLKQLHGPVIFRPYFEQNGNWFWYGDQQPAQFIKMWQMEHDYLVAQGVTNLVWLYATNAAVGNYTTYYPGSAYVDVVGIDAYPPTAQYDTETWQELDALGKPELYAEMGAQPDQDFAASTVDNSQYTKLIEQNWPKVIAAMFWCQSSALDNQLGASTVMDDPDVITKADLPN